MLESRTILDVLDERAKATPGESVFAELDRNGERIRTLNYNELQTQAQRFAAKLAHEVPVDRPILICAEPGTDFVIAFYACLYAGRIAVPAILPRLERIDRLISIAQDTGATHIIISEHSRQRLADLAFRSDVIGRLLPVTVSVFADSGADVTWEDILAKPSVPCPNDIALLQYTSGSTGPTKGVIITHRNLMANSGIIADRFGHTEKSRGLIWLPPYHDMGLIGGIVQPVFRGFPTILMSPERFVMQPILWLRCISRYGITTSGGPNFAYELCVRRASLAMSEGLDLSRWEVAFVGAERVRAGTMERFIEKFSSFGFDGRAVLPCYGLAEATLYVSGRAKGAGISVVQIPSVNGQQIPSVSCGRPAPSLDVRLVDPEIGIEVDVGEPGEIWVRGDSVSLGYWSANKAEQSFTGWLEGEDEPFLRTGDIARLVDDELHVAGRLKAIIIVNGVNYQCEELEQIAFSADPDLAPHAAALIQPLLEDGGEELVLVQELIASASCERREALRLAIKQMMGTVGILLDEVIFVGPGRLPRTESGKVKRLRTCELFVAGELAERLPQSAVS